MSGILNNNLPPQQLPFNRKTKKWRKAHLDWASNRSFNNCSAVRNSVIHKKINYDLLNGKIHMKDLERIINPDKIEASFINNNTIPHYPIINSKIDLLVGEENKRLFDYKVIVTNPNSISEIEENKKNELLQSIQQWIQNTAQSEEDSNKELEKLSQYYTYEWQDFREVRANNLLNHYVKELNIRDIFTQGFIDALAVGEEIYQCDIVGGEPTIEKLNPCKVRVFKSGYSNKIEDADMIILEDYWSPGRIVDTYYDVLTSKDREYIEKMPSEDNPLNSDGTLNETLQFVKADELLDPKDLFWDPISGNDNVDTTLNPYDINGNIRVIRVYWKSRRKIKKVRSYDPVTGEEVFTFYPETYVIDEDRGEEEQIFWINEAWEGTKIGEKIYVNMRPRVVQYNRLSNPSRCHFGIIGSVYNRNDDKPFSLVDIMKPYSYMYDIIHDRLNKILARNWGVLMRLDTSKKPKGWDIDKWLYFGKTMGVIFEDSFNEGTIGAATGKLAGGMNNNSNGAINTTDANLIQQYINILDYIKLELSEVSGINKQREGQIANRETVGGVERATLQSSYITEWLYSKHDDVKKRVLECFLETAKIALKGRSKKFQYLMSDYSSKIMDIDGDEFADSDYGLIVDNSNGTQELNQKLDMLAQAALQNQTLDFSTIMKLYTSCSLAEKQRMVETNEQQLKQMQQEQQQQQMQIQQQQIEQQSKMAQAQMEQQYQMNAENNETKIQVAIINGEAEAQRFAMMNNDEETYSERDKAELQERMRQFDAKLKLDREKLAFEKTKHSEDNALKDKISIRQSKNKVNKN